MVNNKLWFKAKWFGWGWYPASWEGWLCLLGYVGIMMYEAFKAERMAQTDQEAMLSMIPTAVFFTAALIIICYKTGEKPRWRWGK